MGPLATIIGIVLVAITLRSNWEAGAEVESDNNVDGSPGASVSRPKSAGSWRRANFWLVVTLLYMLGGFAAQVLRG